MISSAARHAVAPEKTRPRVECLSTPSMPCSSGSSCMHCRIHPSVNWMTASRSTATCPGSRSLTQSCGRFGPMMLTCPGPKVPMWSPAMKLPWVLVIRWISYSGWAFQPQISLGKSWVMTRTECWGFCGITSRRGMTSAYGLAGPPARGGRRAPNGR